MSGEKFESYRFDSIIKMHGEIFSFLLEIENSIYFIYKSRSNMKRDYPVADVW